MDTQIENLRKICQLLGIDTAENGLTECALANDYLHRIILILGGD